MTPQEFYTAHSFISDPKSYAFDDERLHVPNPVTSWSPAQEKLLHVTLEY